MNSIIMQNKIFIWLLVGVCVLLLIPLTAMQFSTEIVWTLSDFVIAGILLFGAGTIFILIARKFPKKKVLVGIITAGALLYIWAELAVGIFTNWGS